MQLRVLASILLVATTACTKPDAGDDAGDSSSTSGKPTSGDEAGSSTGDPCPIGAEGCPCTTGGGCDAGLACISERDETPMCAPEEPTCTPGDLGCECSEGGGCFDPWVCTDGVCAEGVSATCGDGIVDEFEECDAGEANADEGLATCTASCELPVCGDGLVHSGEACDGGEGCTSSCTLSSCGNGMLDQGEACEPTGESDPECLSSCLDARKLIFVTSVHYKGGEIGGVAGADEKCQALADAAGRPGIFRAWLASSAEDAPAVRFTWHDLPYVDAAGEVLAATYVDFYTARAPHLTETGADAAPASTECAGVAEVAWSVQVSAPLMSDSVDLDCSNWSQPDAQGAVARLTGDLATIVATCQNVACHESAPLLCVEQ